MSLGSWGVRHAQACVGALGRLAREPVGSLLTILVIALALALPVGLNLLVENARAATGDLAGSIELSVYFKTDVPLAKAQQLAQAAGERPEIASVKLIPADKGLEEFRAYSGFGAALAALDVNPLPHVLELRPRPQASTTAALGPLKAWLVSWPEVDVVQIDSQWVQRLEAILATLRRLLEIAAVLLGLGVVAVIGNTIRLEIAGRRGEIEVIRLVGGSNAFVRRPFLYAGVLYGLLGAILAAGIIALAVALLAVPIGSLAGLYGSRFALQGLAPSEFGALAAAGIVLGWLGAWAAAARQLRAVEPRP